MKDKDPATKELTVWGKRKAKGSDNTKGNFHGQLNPPNKALRDGECQDDPRTYCPLHDLVSVSNKANLFSPKPKYTCCLNT